MVLGPNNKGDSYPYDASGFDELKPAQIEGGTATMMHDSRAEDGAKLLSEDDRRLAETVLEAVTGFCELAFHRLLRRTQMEIDPAVKNRILDGTAKIHFLLVFRTAKKDHEITINTGELERDIENQVVQLSAN